MINIIPSQIDDVYEFIITISQVGLARTCLVLVILTRFNEHEAFNYLATFPN